MGDIEALLSQLASDIEALGTRLEMLRSFRQEMEGSGYFKDEERELVQQEILAVDKERNAKIEALKVKIDIYDNQVQRIADEMTHRALVIDGMCSRYTEFKSDPLLDTFAQKQLSLHEQLERARSLLQGA